MNSGRAAIFAVEITGKREGTVTMTSVLSAAVLEAVAWVKSTKSQANGCVEVAKLPKGYRAVRHSQDPSGPALIFNSKEWDAFIEGVQACEDGLI
jgi:predicted secreted Zn-dependent protease